jgi:hypothetical protein
METDELQDTQSMNTSPQPADEHADLWQAMQASELTLRPTFSGDAFMRAVAYPVIVESWDRRKFGRHARRWQANFTQAEQDTIATYHRKFYRWHLVSGTPRTVSLRLDTLMLLQRAVNFFSEC